MVTTMSDVIDYAVVVGGPEFLKGLTMAGVVAPATAALTGMPRPNPYTIYNIMLLRCLSRINWSAGANMVWNKEGSRFDKHVWHCLFQLPFLAAGTMTGDALIRYVMK